MPWRISFLLLMLALAFRWTSARAETLRIATYNLESYLDQPTGTRPIKSAEARAKIRESIHALAPDVLAMQEMGGITALRELQDSLKTDGLDFPYRKHVTGFDTNIHIAVLSRFPFTAVRPHTNESFLASGRRYRLSRGFAELEVQVNTNFSFTLLAAHLKSKRALGEADEAELRLEEAKILRERIDALLANSPDEKLVVLGDFNDSKDSLSTRTIIGRYRQKLLDTRPAERNGDARTQTNSSSPAAQRNISWTHYYAQDDSYSRIDFILISPAMARHWVPEQTFVLALPNWGLASDHRPVLACFETN